MTDPRRAALPPLFTASLVVATLAVFLQSVTAGIFVDHDGRDTWVTVHGVIADLTWVSALVAAVVGLARLRRNHRDLSYGAAVLFVLALAQTGIGHLITDGGVDGLIVVHVPLAMLIFGVAVWLLVRLRRVRRLVAVDPYGAAEAEQHLPIANRR